MNSCFILRRLGFRTLVCGVAMTLITAPRCSDAQIANASVAHITVVVINPRSGQPLRNIDVMASSWNGQEDENTAVISYARTDQQGKAFFTVPSPVLRNVSLVTAPPDAFEFCSTLKFPTVQLLDHGVVGAYDPSCGRLKWAGGGPTPGEAVIFVKPLNFWQRMFKEIP